MRNSYDWDPESKRFYDPRTGTYLAPIKGADEAEAWIRRVGQDVAVEAVMSLDGERVGPKGRCATKTLACNCIENLLRYGDRNIYQTRNAGRGTVRLLIRAHLAYLARGRMP